MIRESVEAHYERHWGRPAGRTRHATEAHPITVLTWEPQSTAEGVFLHATVGMSEHPPPGPPTGHRFELATGLKPDRPEVAESLAALATYPARVGRTLDHGHTLTTTDRLWSVTTMNVWLVVLPNQPLLPVLELDQDTHVEILTAIPTYQSELELKQRDGLDALSAHWQLFSVEIFDPERTDLLRRA